MDGFLRYSGGIGYIGAVLILIALTRKRNLHFRVINSLGTILLLIHSLLINDITFVVLNGVALCINLVMITKHYRKNNKRR